ncbi:hypothetical protein ACFL1N_17345 [Thermodesulfobacteriota bacterium]
MNSYKCFRPIFIILIFFITQSVLYAEGSEKYLVRIDSKKCEHGLHHQPNGPFSVFLFCDGGLGENIGIICSEPGAGPGKIVLEQPKAWNNWYVNDRFWQDKSWATDITSFAWTPSGKYLFVATNRVYGDGKIYEIDLLNRSSKIIKIKDEDNYNTNEYEGYAIIEDIDLKNQVLKVAMYLYGLDEKEIILKDEIKFK